MTTHVGSYNVFDVDNGWAAWSPWSECQTTCEDGMQYRNRSCDVPDESLEETYCIGENEDIHNCTVTQLCPGQHRFLHVSPLFEDALRLTNA